MSLKIVCISDTHEKHKKISVPACDILIHTGDFTRFGSRKAVANFAEWFAKQPARFKVCVPGNHDKSLQKYPDFGHNLFGGLGIHYLCDSSIVIEGIKFYGTPWVPRYGPWAFMHDAGSPELKKRYEEIPDDTDILLCHGPPMGYGDRNTRGNNSGSKFLLERIQKIKPKLLCCGHIHENFGVFYTDFGTVVVNSAQLNFIHMLINKPIELIWETDHHSNEANNQNK